jgi:hypothetical protein
VVQVHARSPAKTADRDGGCPGAVATHQTLLEPIVCLVSAPSSFNAVSAFCIGVSADLGQHAAARPCLARGGQVRHHLRVVALRVGARWQWGREHRLRGRRRCARLDAGDAPALERDERVLEFADRLAILDQPT